MTTPREFPSPTRFFYQYRGLLLAPPLLFSVLCTWAETENDWVIFPVGLSLFGVGVGLRFWAQCHLHYRLSVRKQLTTTGPYRFVRNPIYIANFLIVGGLAVTSELLWLVPAMLLWTAYVYRGTVRYEESHLARKYGSPYEAYCAHVPRWKPALPVGVVSSGPSVRPFFASSAFAELHNLLILAPFILKEIIH